MKISLNYFTSGTAVKIIKGVIYILVVLYHDNSDHKKNDEIRLPGGTFQFIDILTALEEVAQRIGLSLDKKNWLTQEIKKISEDYTTKISKMPADSNSERFAIREVFLKHIAQAEDYIESVIYGADKIKILENVAKIHTLKRELGEECATVSCSEPIQCGFTKRGEHSQFPFLIMESDTPDEYNGSSDPYIRESKYLPMLEVKELLYKNHKPFLNNTLSQLAQVWTYEEDKKSLVVELNKYLEVNV